MENDAEDILNSLSLSQGDKKCTSLYRQLPDLLRATSLSNTKEPVGNRSHAGEGADGFVTVLHRLAEFYQYGAMKKRK